MRMMLTVSIPNREFNAAVQDGTAGQKMMRILEEAKPEAVYFTERNGRRACVLVVDMADASQVPVLAEPWFMTFNAEVEFDIAMTPDDLKRAGLEELGKKWG